MRKIIFSLGALGMPVILSGCNTCSNGADAIIAGTDPVGTQHIPPG